MVLYIVENNAGLLKFLHILALETMAFMIGYGVALVVSLMIKDDNIE